MRGSIRSEPCIQISPKGKSTINRMERKEAVEVDERMNLSMKDRENERQGTRRVK